MSSVRLPRGLGTRPTDLSSTLLFARCDGAQAIADQLTSERALFDDERERLLGEWTTLYNKMDSEKAALEKEISALRLKNNEMRVRWLVGIDAPTGVAADVLSFLNFDACCLNHTIPTSSTG